MNVKSAQSVFLIMHKSFALRIFIVALILRLIPVIAARGLGIGLDDMFQYDMLARSLASGNGFRWYAQQDLNQLAPFVHFDLASVKEYDPLRSVPRYIPHFLQSYIFSAEAGSRDSLPPVSHRRYFSVRH